MKLAALGLSLLCAVLLAGPARAEPNEADRATARALAIEGHTALQKKDFKTAADRFGRADSLVHAPTLVVDWARALQGLGRFVEAHEKYELVLREGVDGSSPKSWTRALEEAKKELDALKPRLGWVTVILKDPTDATVTIDDVVVPPAALGVKRAADPGFPEVKASAPGYEPFKQTVTVGAGEERSLEVTMVKLPEVAPPPAETSPDVYRARPSQARHVASYVVLGVGGAALLAGGITGAMALKKRSDLRSECIENVCRSSSEKKISTYHTYGTISGATLAVGVVGIAAGVVLLLTEPKQDSVADAGLHWQPLVGLGIVGAQGSFQ